MLQLVVSWCEVLLLIPEFFYLSHPTRITQKVSIYDGPIIKPQLAPSIKWEIISNWLLQKLAPSGLTA